MSKTPTSFSTWMRNHLKDAFCGLITQDIDFVLLNENNKYFIVEEKNIANARTGPAQAVIYKMLDEILSEDNDFLGCHKATLESNGIWLDMSGKVSVNDFLINPNAYKYNAYNQTWYDKVLYFNLKYLWDGKGIPPVRKTEKEHTFNRESLLEPELLKHNVYRANIDWVFVNYVTGNFVLLSESNCFNNDLIQHIIFQMYSYNKSSKIVKNPKSLCEYKFLGAYEISYSVDMRMFYINGQPVDSNEAIEVLNLDTDEIKKYMIE